MSKLQLVLEGEGVVLRIQLATLVFGLYLFIIGGTVAALFTPLTQLLNHLICMGMVIGIVIYIMSGRTCTSYEGRGHLNAKCDQTLQKLPAWMHVKMPPVLFGALLLALLWVVITTVTSIYPRLSWEVAIQRIWYAVTFIIAYLLLTHLRHLRAIVYAMLSVAGYEQMQSVAQWLTWLPRRPPGEPFVRVVQGTLNHPNDLAMFLVLVLPLWFALLCESGGEGSRKWMIIRRVIAGIGLLTCMFCLMLATSRSGYMGLFALAFAFIAGAMRASLSQSLSKWLRYNWVIVTALAIAFIIGICCVPGNWVVRRLIAMFTHIDISVLNRLAMWYYTCNMIGARWLFGWGVGCYPLAYPQFVPVDGVRMIFLHPHNWYLHLSAEMGIVGATFWFAFIIMALAIGWQRLKADADARNSNGIAQLYRLAAWSGCIGFMVGSMSNSEWEIPAIMIAFFTLLAIASGGAYPASAHQRGEGQLSILRNHSSAFARMMQWCIGVTIGLLFATTVIRWDIANFAFALGIAQRNTVQGIKWLQRASRWDSRNAYYHAQLALISFRTLNDGLTARRHYRRALKCYPYDGVYYHNLAWLHLLDWRDAVGSWNITAISIPSHKRERAVSAGMRAVAYFRKALRYDPANPRYRTCLLIAQALAEEARGDIGRATELCKRALKADWFPAWLPNHTAKLLRAEGRFSEANRLARLHRGAQSKHLGANGLPFRYHLPVRYRRIGVVDEAIVIEH